MAQPAIGMIETRGLVALVEGTDAMLKAANVELAGPMTQVGNALVTAVVLSGCVYNDFQRLDEQTKAAWSEVLNQYQRRADLIPNIVNTVKGEANFEQETLTKVVEARAKAT